MAIARPAHANRLRGREYGLSLVELMVAVTISLLLLAGLVSLVINANKNQANLTQLGAQNENGRYALQLMGGDLKLAGFYGLFASAPAPTATTLALDPCLTDTTDLQSLMSLPIQAYTGSTTQTTPPITCIPAAQWQSDTDILIVRRASTVALGLQGDSSTNLTPNAVYIQANNTQILVRLGSNPASAFTLTKMSNGAYPAIRAYEEHIYFISPCLQTDASGACPANSNSPTLKRIDLTVGPALTNTTANPPVPLVSGVQNMHIDFGVDTNGDGAPDKYVADAGTLAAADWGNVVTVCVSLLVRSDKPITGWTDNKSYSLGPNNITVPAKNDSYVRHVFTQVIRLTNIDQRRE